MECSGTGIKFYTILKTIPKVSIFSTAPNALQSAARDIRLIQACRAVLACHAGICCSVHSGSARSAIAIAEALRRACGVDVFAEGAGDAGDGADSGLVVAGGAGHR